MATKTVEITVCDIASCGVQITEADGICASCSATVCWQHRIHLEHPYKGNSICLPCIEVKLGITPKENA